MILNIKEIDAETSIQGNIVYKNTSYQSYILIFQGILMYIYHNVDFHNFTHSRYYKNNNITENKITK